MSGTGFEVFLSDERSSQGSMPDGSTHELGARETLGTDNDSPGTRHLNNGESFD
jgi:hypothetical protein